MRSQWFGRRAAGFATARYALTALAIGAAITVGVDSVSGQGAAAGQSTVSGPSNSSQPPLPQPPMDTSPKPWTGKRTPDGQPDVQGSVWHVPSGGTRSLENLGETHGSSAGLQPERRLISRIVDPPDGRIPHQPWALARQKQQEYDLDHPTQPTHVDPQARCLQGFPRYHWYVTNYKILQPAGMVVFTFELYHAYRVIRVDGSPHIGPSMKLWWGDSIGRWEGNTLVVDTTNHSGKTRLSMKGDFVTDKVHFTERFVFVDPDNMIYEVTVNDPTVYTRPWTIRVPQKRGVRAQGVGGENPDELWEDTCLEGDSARPSLVEGYAPKP